MKILLIGCTRNAGLTVLRSLARAGHQVFAADDRRLPLNLHSRFVEGYDLLPPESSAACTDALVTLVRRYRPDVLLPLTMAGLVSRARDRLQRETNVLAPCWDAFAAVNDKVRLLAHCRAFGVPHPREYSLAEARETLAAKGGGVVIRPADNLGGGTGVHIVGDACSLPAAYRATAERHGQVSITDYVPGPDSNNYALHAVLDRNGEAVSTFAFQKLRLWPLRTGITAAGVSRHLPELAGLVMPMLKQLGWVGPVDVEFKLDPRDRTMKLIEINGRFSGAVGFPMACDLDLAGIVCRLAAGESVLPAAGTAYCEGLVYWSPHAYVRSVLQELRESRSVTGVARTVATELRGRRVGNPYELADFAPTLGKLLLRSKGD